MVQAATISKSTFKPILESYIEFNHVKPVAHLKSYEDAYIGSYIALINNFSKSIESVTLKDYIMSFINKTSDFVKKIIGIILKIIFNVINFFKKLILNGLDMAYIKDRSNFYTMNKNAILKNYNAFGNNRFVKAIPPKNANAFLSNNNIVLAINQTVNLLEEIYNTFENHTRLWKEQNIKSSQSNKNSFFDNLRDKVNIIKTDIRDSKLFFGLGISTLYDIKAVSLYDNQVKDYLLSIPGSDLSDGIGVLKTIFGMPKTIINIFLYGVDKANPEVIAVSEFLKNAGPKEFDKLLLNNMVDIRNNIIAVNNSIKKMESIAGKLENSSMYFLDSLKTNVPAIVKTVYGDEKWQKSLEDINQYVVPLISVSCSIYYYFSTLIVDYGIRYCMHRKALFDSSLALLTNENDRPSDLKKIG